MNIIFLVVLQVIAAYLLAVGLLFVVEVGGIWELVVMAAGSSVGMWVLGIMSSKTEVTILKLFSTFIGSVVGAAIFYALPSFGVNGIFLIVIGALVGYYAFPS